MYRDPPIALEKGCLTALLDTQISDQNVVFIYLAIALGLEVVIWQVDSIMGNAIAYAFVGVCLGPM